MADRQTAGWGVTTTASSGGSPESDKAHGMPKTFVRETAEAPASQPYDPFLDARARLDEVERLHREGKLDQARQLCQTIIRRFPDYFSALHRYGVILADQRRYAEAVLPLVNAVMLNPRAWSATTALSTVYLQLGALDIAAQTLKHALQQNPNHPTLLTVMARIYSQDRDYEAGAEACRLALSRNPSMDSALVGLGNCLENLGELTEAAGAFEEAVKRNPHSLEYIYLLSRLSHSHEIDVLSLIDAATPSPSDDLPLFEARRAVTRALVLDRAGRYAEAWETLLAGNRILAKRSRENAYAESQERGSVLEALKRGAGRTQPAALAVGGKWPISLFILGPSRCGKTTMERLVGTMDGVRRGYENPIMRNAVIRTFQSAGLPTKDRITDVPPKLENPCRGFYLEELERRAKSATVFTNTGPTHIDGALRIAEVMPNVRFALIKRDMVDTSLRILMKIYDAGNFYAYDLATVREYLDWYDRMIDIVAERLPTISTVVHYEEMIADPRRTLREVATLCGLPEPTGAIPEVGDDRGCAEPYRDLMEAVA